MVELLRKGAYLLQGKLLIEDADKVRVDELNDRLCSAGCLPLSAEQVNQDTGRAGTLAYQILTAHNTSGDWKDLKIKFDALTSHDITYVGIIQTAIASGMKEFPVPYVMTNCHNSLCAVGGTINEDDHIFGLSAAHKYGGIFVPTHQAVIHQYMREMMSGCGQMILGSDSHTRYGALGTMAIGEGGPEIAKQLLRKTYDIAYPDVVAVYLEGTPAAGVGPQDVALAIIGAVFKDGFVKNKVMEFVGPGVSNLSVDFRNGIDVMTTETTCLTSIWRTDGRVKEYYAIHGRPQAYCELNPGEISYYDGVIKVDLGKVRPMIALPFHPSNIYSIEELNRNGADILRAAEIEGQKQLENSDLKLDLTGKLVNGRLQVEQGIIVGCSGGTFENLVNAARILDGKSTGNGAFSLSVYPASQPVFSALIENRSIEKLIAAGAVIRSAFCGPCFGAGDTPANNQLSIRHATRNFPNREGAKPVDGQIASVALMDACSIAATARNGGRLTPATEVEFDTTIPEYRFNKAVYDNRVYQGFGEAEPETKLVFGPNIANWPSIRALPKNLLLKLASIIHDPVTTTDELIPSGETSSYRSNPFKLADFTLSRKDPAYVGRAKAAQALEAQRQAWDAGSAAPQAVEEVFKQVAAAGLVEGALPEFIRETGIGSTIFAKKPGDGSAREQAASCQRVLGGDANIALEYATKRYRSNVINWGMLPFTISEADMEKLTLEDHVLIPNIRAQVESGAASIPAFVVNAKGKTPIELKLENLSKDDRDIILSGCLMNYYAQEQ